MIKTSALVLVEAMAFSTATQMQGPMAVPPDISALPTATNAVSGRETLAVYYSPLTSTKSATYIGFGIAYHMAIVYTNAGA